MDPSWLPFLLATAWLVPLFSFVFILFVGKHLGPHGKNAGLVATSAIVFSGVCSFTALFAVWLPNHPVHDASHHGGDHHEAAHEDEGHAALAVPMKLVAAEGEHAESGHSADGHSAEAHHGEHANNGPEGYKAYTADWYELGVFGSLKLSISYYIDALTVGMFCMVSLIASCVHFYAMGYMHDELHDFTDPEVTLSNGENLKRPGRYYRFFQYLSLFCFSMFGIVIAGNIAMVFVFWELVGICSYFLIGFYIERKSASTAANKAFIVNRVGDFGMLIGLMALWSSLGTFAFGDMTGPDGETEKGMFSLLRTEENDYHLQPTEGMLLEGGRFGESATSESAAEGGETEESPNKAGWWLLLVAGVGIFCGCVGKSAQFPLHVWLPDAMEGPTPVSALVHSATMVAAGVYLVGRFFPVLSPEALLVVAYIGCITLFVAATIAITATDIKRVLAYSTVSQLGYMMLALGLGGWVAGMFHLITHAFFKSLLFMCSGSVIHGVHTNDMTEMGGLRKKMPITAYTMLIGCLAIIGAGIPIIGPGFSGYYSKDAIIEQAFSFGSANPTHWILQWAPVAGAFITAFYMFRLWFMTFAGEPRNKHRYDHAHESPRVMTAPLILLSVFAIGVGWSLPGTDLSVVNLLEQARPVGTQATTSGEILTALTVPDEHISHQPEFKIPAGWAAFLTASAGVLLATLIYLVQFGPRPAELKKAFQPIHGFLTNKWWFDELYDWIFVKPTKVISGCISWFDRGVIDFIIHSLAAISKGVSQVFAVLLDNKIVNGFVDTFAKGTWDTGVWLKRLQTGSLRQYVMFIAVGTILLFVAISFVQNI
ncbi:MAG: NADH-quinone oxidoreductase subunit L [Planctomycetota bacterium]